MKEKKIIRSHQRKTATHKGALCQVFMVFEWQKSKQCSTDYYQPLFTCKIVGIKLVRSFVQWTFELRSVRSGDIYSYTHKTTHRLNLIYNNIRTFCRHSNIGWWVPDRSIAPRVYHIIAFIWPLSTYSRHNFRLTCTIFAWITLIKREYGVTRHFNWYHCWMTDNVDCSCRNTNSNFICVEK